MWLVTGAMMALMAAGFAGLVVQANRRERRERERELYVGRHRRPDTALPGGGGS